MKRRLRSDLITWTEVRDDAANDEDARSLLIATEPLLGWKEISSKNPRKRNRGGFKAKKDISIANVCFLVFIFWYTILIIK